MPRPPPTRSCWPTYDALKDVRPRPRVVGGGPRAARRRPTRTVRQTHSPTTFIRDLGPAYRASGRDRADDGRLRDPSLRRDLKMPPTARTRRRPRSRSPTIRSSWGCSTTRSRHRPARRHAPDPLRRVRRPDHDPAGQSRRLQSASRASATRVSPTRPPTTAGDRLATASRPSRASSSSTSFDETRLDGWQSGSATPTTRRRRASLRSAGPRRPRP